MTSIAGTGPTAVRLRRSLEYVSAADPEAIARARRSRADVVCLDLEDSVPLSVKDIARRTVADAVREGGFGDRELVVRINGHGTPEHDADIMLCRSIAPAGIVVPKVRDRDMVEAVHAALGKETIALWCMIEDARGLINASAIAASANVTALIVGGQDLAETLGIPRRHISRGIAAHVTPVVVASRAAGISAISAVAFDDNPGDEALGFDGRSCYHGQDIAAINRCFTPSQADVEAAQTMLDSGRIYGEHLDHARALLAFARATAQRDAPP